MNYPFSPITSPAQLFLRDSFSERGRLCFTYIYRRWASNAEAFYPCTDFSDPVRTGLACLCARPGRWNAARRSPSSRALSCQPPFRGRRLPGTSGHITLRLTQRSTRKVNAAVQYICPAHTVGARPSRAPSQVAGNRASHYTRLQFTTPATRPSFLTPLIS